MMAQRRADVHPSIRGRGRSYAVGMLIMVGVVVVAVVLIMLVAPKEGTDGAPSVVAVDDAGLHLAGAEDGGPAAIGWSSIFEVEVVTRPRLGGTWYGFEVASETGGRVVVDADGPAETFIAHAHHLGGLDHAALTDALTRRRGRTVCFRR